MIKRVVSDWRQFVDEVSWLLGANESANVGDSRPWSRGTIDELPQMSRLLTTATVTPIQVGELNLELLAWGPPDARRGWLCLPPETGRLDDVHPLHERMLTLTGGILERFGEPKSWWNNQAEVLTISAAHVSVADVLEDYAWLWHDDGLEMPIDPTHYYAVSVEANGNLSLVHRVTGELILFAPDHAFDDVTPLPGCPPYSLMTINGVPDLRTWIEHCSAPWLQGL